MHIGQFVSVINGQRVISSPYYFGCAMWSLSSYHDLIPTYKQNSLTTRFTFNVILDILLLFCRQIA